MEVTQRNKNDNLYSKTDNNFYYDDEDDKGFNHLELRRFKRLYTEGNAKKGDEAQPMDEVRDWLKKEVFENN
jgi:hypothetical protein